VTSTPPKMADRERDDPSLDHQGLPCSAQTVLRLRQHVVSCCPRADEPLPVVGPYRDLSLVRGPVDARRDSGTASSALADAVILSTGQLACTHEDGTTVLPVDALWNGRAVGYWSWRSAACPQ